MHDPLGRRRGRQAGVTCATSGRARTRSQEVIAAVDRRGDVHPRLRRRLRRRRALARACPPRTGDTFAWDDGVHLRAQAAVLRRHGPPSPDPVTDIRGARVLAQAGRLGHHRPHLPGRGDQGRQPGRPVPAEHGVERERLQLLRLAPRQPRGDDPRHVRQHPAAQPARAGHRGRLHPGPHPAGRAGHDDLRRLGVLPGGRHAAGRAGRQGVRLRAPPGTGRPRAPRCSACGPSSPSPTSGSTGPT